jgi:hypothetical protein
MYTYLLPLILIVVAMVGWRAKTESSRRQSHRPDAIMVTKPEKVTPQSGSTKGEGWPPKQPMDAFLVVDVEGTCEQDLPWGHPNEIIVRVCQARCHMI